MYQILSSFAQTWGLMSFIFMFAAVLAYALWPKNKGKFDQAAAMPLHDEGPLTEDAQLETQGLRQEPSHG